jgi:putative ABC transport system permease protein
MIINYIKIAFRNLKTHKLFSFINIFGLAIGIATCLVISLWVLRELSYDDFHQNSDRIYRVERELFRDQLYSRWPVTSGLYKQALINDIPEIENAVRFWRRNFTITDKNNNSHRQESYASDNSIFEIFDFNLVEGNTSQALTQPNSVVLTEEKALKYFGTSDVIGELLTVDLDGNPTEFKITGTLEEVPKNSHIKFDMLISMSTYSEKRFDSWRSNYLYTYVLLKPNTSIENLEAKLKSFVTQHLEPYYDDLLVSDFSIHEVLKMYLFPINKIHLEPSVNWELETGGNINSVYIFSTIAVLILVIAGMNFTNLSTARANKRAKEVSLRKTIGAGQFQLRIQFLQESILLALTSLFFAILFLMLLLLPIYNSIFNETLTFNFLFQIKNILALVGITILIGLFAGLYPAFYITKFEPSKILRGGSFSGRKKSGFQRNVVIIQFCMSITLIVCMSIVYNQMEYIQNKSIGFEKENVVIIPTRSGSVSQGYNSYRSKLLSNNKIISMAASGDLPGDDIYSNGSIFNREESDENINMIFMSCDYDLIDAYKMEMISGRTFSREFSTDTSGTLIINEAAARRIGWTPQEAVGKKLSYGNQLSETEIVGVVKNFNFRSLRQEVEPMMFMLSPNNISAISVRILPGETKASIDFLKQNWEETFPGVQFEHSFMDNRINQLYENEKNMQSLLIAFSSLSILVACLGLFGLAAFTAEEKTKEIGIRKTLGASIPTILMLLSKKYVKWVSISILIAWPFSYYLMDSWLQNFAYHVKLGWIPFITAAGFSLLIAIVTVSFQVVKAARSNPIDSLKYE